MKSLLITPLFLIPTQTPKLQQTTSHPPQPLTIIQETQIRPLEPLVASIQLIEPLPLPKPARQAEDGPNTYQSGQCTWWVKSKRPDLPSNLGNANTWYSRAAAQGWEVGTEPRVGAVGTKGMHVVYVEAVNGDGTVTISEMNYDYVPYHKRTVVKPANIYRYIYL